MKSVESKKISFNCKQNIGFEKKTFVDANARKSA